MNEEVKTPEEEVGEEISGSCCHRVAGPSGTDAVVS